MTHTEFPPRSAPNTTPPTTAEFIEFVEFIDWPPHCSTDAGAVMQGVNGSGKFVLLVPDVLRGASIPPFSSNAKD